jgi:hypothetical protein
MRANDPHDVVVGADDQSVGLDRVRGSARVPAAAESESDARGGDYLGIAAVASPRSSRAAATRGCGSSATKGAGCSEAPMSGPVTPSPPPH